VPVELIFDQSIGRVFVGRVAGNICSPEMFGSFEYGAAVLGIPLIMVRGHDGCGAVKAAMAAQPVPGQISSLFAPIRPAVERAGPDLEATIRANAQIQANLLRTASPVITEDPLSLSPISAPFRGEQPPRLRPSGGVQARLL
jgi:carbonic anhydrase